MNKKTSLIIVGVIVIIILGVGIYFWLNNSGSTSSNNNGSPFGTGGDNSQGTNNPQPTTNQNPTQTTPSNVTASGLRKIADGPIAGATIFTRASSTIIRYVDRATGNVYEYDPQANTTTRITNTTIPKTVEVAWGKSGESLVMRSLKNSTIESYFGFFSTSTATTTGGSLEEIAGSYMPENINSLSFSPLKDKIFYTEASIVGIEGFVSDKNGGNTKSVWQFPTTEWLSQWATENSISLTTKASNGVPGGVFSLNLKTGSFSPTLSDIPGLTTLTSPDGSLILYSQSQNSVTTLSLYDVKSGQSASMPFTTLPEKCLWENTSTLLCAVPSNGMNGYLPDNWYQGLTSFSDTIWQANISATTNTANVLSNLDSNSIDAIELAVSPDNKNIIFENKKDYSLWLMPLP